VDLGRPAAERSVQLALSSAPRTVTEGGAEKLVWLLNKYRVAKTGPFDSETYRSSEHLDRSYIF